LKLFKIITLSEYCGDTQVSLLKLRALKPEIRVIGIDGPKHVAKKRCRIFGVVFRGHMWLDGVMYTSVQTNGLDATQKICRMVRRSGHYGQIRLLLLHGLTFAGWNPVDIHFLCQRLKKPVIVFSKQPQTKLRITHRIQSLQHMEKRLDALAQAGEPISFKLADGCKPVYIQLSGISLQDAENVLRLITRRGCIPEPLRIAHLISSAFEATAS